MSSGKLTLIVLLPDGSASNACASICSARIRLAWPTNRSPEGDSVTGRAARSNSSPEEKSFRHQYIRLLVDRVEVGDAQIRITGGKNNLLAAVAAEAAGLVPNTVRKWRTRTDKDEHSNYWEISVSMPTRTYGSNVVVS